MKKLYYLTALILTIPFISLAQSNYKPGYVVTSAGDTLKGYIDYQEWDANPDAINFKKTLTGKVTKYGVDNAASFGIDKLDTYIKYTGPISTDATDPNKVPVGKDSTFRTGAIFLRVLEKGSRIALYSYKDDIKMRFYIGDNPDYTPRELIYRVYFDPNYDENHVQGGHNNRTIFENIFRKQLSGEALKFNELTDGLTILIARAEYRDGDIMDIVSKINHMTKAEYGKSHYTGASFQLFAGAGMSITTTTPSSSGPFYAAGARAYTSYLPAIFLGANFFVNPATRKLQLGIQLSVAKSQLREKYDSKVYPYVPDEAMYNTTAFSGSMQIIYNFYNRDNFKVFAGVGVFAASYIFSNNYIGAQDHNNSAVDLNAAEPWLFNKFNDAFLFKAGVQFSKHLQIFGEYRSNIAPSISPYYSLSSTSEQIGLIYLFN